jgi:hypothetical protein
MASFKFTSAVPLQGTTFIFGLWVYVVDGAGSFCWFTVDNHEAENSCSEFS